MNALMRQAQKMQKQMEETTKMLEEQEYSVTSGGGAVEIVITGKYEVKSIRLDPELVDPEDVETLQDTVVAAVNEALRKVETEANAARSKIGVPGGFGF